MAAQEQGTALQHRRELGNLDSANNDKLQFLQLVQENMDRLRSDRPDRFKELLGSTVEQRARIVSNQGPIAINRQPYMKRAWQAELRRSPDRAAVVRWLRIGFWYALHRIARPDEGLTRFGNNYDDSHYVFLSTYTRHLLTEDPGMADAARAVTENRVRVYDRIEDVPHF